jgi:hypothetical protein
MDNKRIKLLAIRSLKKADGESKLNESRIKYDDNHNERMDPTLAKQLRERKHSLGNHPAFPEDDEMHFEEKMMSKRFSDVLKRFKRHHGVDEINVNEVTKGQRDLMLKIIDLEESHKDELIQKAKEMIMEDFDVDEGDLVIEADLTTDFTLNLDKTKIKMNPSTDIEFDSHDELVQANKEVYKRRMVNALIQGSAKKVNHMFNLIDEDLQDMEPVLPSLYSKLMSSADYMYMVQDDTKPRMIGGLVNVEFPKTENDVPKIKAQAICLPVLIHEMVKGLMEVLAYHSLPKDPKIAQFVIDKADFMSAETWDMRLGPPLWEKFLDALPSDDYKLKHHVFVDLVSLPPEKFNDCFREILMGSRKGKAIVNDMLNDVKDELRDDEFDNVVDRISDDEFLGPEDLDNLDSGTWFNN